MHFKDVFRAFVDYKEFQIARSSNVSKAFVFFFSVKIMNLS